MSRWKPAGPSPSRQIIVPSTVTSRPRLSASGPANQASPMVSTPPASSGTSGGWAPLRRTARVISQMPTPTAAASTARKPGRKKNSGTRTSAPSPTPDADGGRQVAAGPAGRRQRGGRSGRAGPPPTPEPPAGRRCRLRFGVGRRERRGEPSPSRTGANWAVGWSSSLTGVRCAVGASSSRTGASCEVGASSGSGRTRSPRGRSAPNRSPTGSSYGPPFGSSCRRTGGRSGACGPADRSGPDCRGDHGSTSRSGQGSAGGRSDRSQPRGSVPL